MTLVPSVVVRVRFANRRQLKQAYLRDLSKGTLFIRTDSPLALGEGVLMVLELPSGDSIELTGEVARVVTQDDSTATGPLGMSVRLRDLSPDKRARIEELLARSRTLVPVAAPEGQMRLTPSAPHMPVPAMEIIVRALRRMIWLCADAGALASVTYYQILGLEPSATTDEIREACTMLRVLLEPGSPPEGLADELVMARQGRVTALHALISEIEQTLTNGALRAGYDSALGRER